MAGPFAPLGQIRQGDVKTLKSAVARHPAGVNGQAEPLPDGRAAAIIGARYSGARRQR